MTTMRKTVITDNKHELGTCFQRSFHLLVDGEWEGLTVPAYAGDPFLVHGIVWGDEPGYHVHAWVEDSLFCYDFLNGRILRTPKHQYYALGKIKRGLNELYRYTRSEAIRLSTSKGFYYFSNLPCHQ
jgi:hypothetical protein